MSTGKTLALHSALNPSVSGVGDELYIIRADVTTNSGYPADGSYIKHYIDKPEEEIYAAYLANKTIVCDVYDLESQRYRMHLAGVRFLGSEKKRYYSFFAVKQLTMVATLQIQPNANGVYEAYLQHEHFVRSAQIPKELPSPYKLVYINKNGDRTNYNGSADLEIDMRKELTPLEWFTVQNKPFTSEMLVPATEFSYANVVPGFESFPGMTFILQPFELVEGDEYVTDINGIRFSSTCVPVDALLAGKTIRGLAIGNAGALIDEPNRLPFGAIQFTNPYPVADGIYAYGAYIPLINFGESEYYEQFAAGTFSIMRKEKTDCFLKPEALPLMSPDAIGGARIGDGLVMTGDVLQVDIDEVVSRVLAALSTQ